MSFAAKEKIKGTFIVPLGILIILVPFSLLIGWNLLTGLLFWFIIVPVLTHYLPAKISKSTSHLFESVAGLVIFYGFMVFMIYNHNNTDFFKVMMASFVFNLAIVALISWVRKQEVTA